MSDTQGGATPSILPYDEAVTEARTLVKRSETDQWRLAQLTWEQLKAGTTLGQWAGDIGVSRRWAGVLRDVWEAHSDVVALPHFADAVAEIKPGGYQAGIERGRAEPPTPETVVQAAKENPEIFQALVQDELFRGDFLEAIAHMPREEGELGKALRSTRDEEWAATLWMAKTSVHLAEAQNFSPEDVFNKARPRDVDSWDRTLEDGIPFLSRIQNLIRQRQTGKLELVR